MNVDRQPNWIVLNRILFAGIVLLIGVYSMTFLYPRWQAKRPLIAGDYPALPCLKTSYFYTVHLTTYFLAAAADGATDPKRKAQIFPELCDHIPGPGRVVFSVVLMEEDTRDQSLVFSLSQYDFGGHLTLVKALPPSLHPHGVLTLDVPAVERGKYLLKLAFGEAKSKDDIIEMPILVGQ